MGCITSHAKNGALAADILRKSAAVLLCVLLCSCAFCRAPVYSAVLLCILPCSCVFCVFCRAPVCSAVLLCVLQCSCVFCCNGALAADILRTSSAVLLRVLPCSCVFCRAPVCSAVLLCILPCSCFFCRAPSWSVCSAVRLCVLQCSCVLCRAPECCALLLWSPGSAPPKIRQNEDPQGFAKPSAARRSATTTTATTRTAEHRSTAEQEHGRTHRSTAEHTPHARRHARYDIPARQTNNRAYFTRLVDKSDASRSCPVRFPKIAISPETSSQKLGL